MTDRPPPPIRLREGGTLPADRRVLPISADDVEVVRPLTSRAAGIGRSHMWRTVTGLLPWGRQ